VDQQEFNEVHSICVGAFRDYAAEADLTAAMLAHCTPEPMPLQERLRIAIQQQTENTAHSIYLHAKRVLHEAARLGYAFTGSEEPDRG
jgi:negative regulator of sigma E activity